MARFSLRALSVVALWAALPPADALAQDCPPLRHSARSETATLRLPAVPGQWYAGWLIEGGRELRLRDGELTLSAAPARYARIPLWLQADHDGAVTLHIDAGSGPATSMLNIELNCSHADAGLPATLQQISRLAARHAEHPDPALGWRLAWRLFTTHHRHPDDSELRLWLLQQQLGLAQRAGLMEQAAGWAEQLAQLAQRQDLRRAHALALLDQGRALLTLDAGAAAEAIDQATGELSGLGLTYPALVAQHEGCLLSRMRGENAAAIECYRSVAAGFHAAEEWTGQITAQTNLVTALFFAGRYGEGRQALQRNRPLVALHGTDWHHARQALLDSQLATWSADFDTALSSLFDAREVFLRESDPRSAAQVERLLGHRYSLAGELGRALFYYRESRRRLRDHGLQRSDLYVQLHEARAHGLLGELDRAYELAADAETRAKSGNNRVEWRNALLLLAELELRLRRPERVAPLLARLGDSLTASQERRRLELLTELRAPGGVDERALADWLDKDLALRRYVDALRSAGLLVERHVAAGRHVEAKRVIDRVQDAVGPALARLRTPGIRDALIRELHALHARRTLAWPAGPVREDEAISLVADLDRLVQSIEGVTSDSDKLLELERQIGEDLLGSESAPSAMARDRALLQLDGATPKLAVSPLNPQRDRDDQWPGTLVYPVMRRDEGGLLLRSSNGWQWLPVDLPLLRRGRRELHAQLSAGHASQETLQAVADDLRIALNSESWVASDAPLSIVVNGEFAGLPIEWLREQLGSSGSVSWIHRTPLQAPSVPRSIALVGALAGSGSVLPGLPEVAAELALVRDAWKSLPGREPVASRDGLLEALALEGALVHIAAHGRSADAREEEAGLWLQDDQGQPVFVSALRLRRSVVRAAVVVLSACETGYSPAGAGIGFGGVAGSLIEAGAGVVVATRWPVGDRTAKRFAQHFHEALQQAPREPERALIAAQAALRAAPSTRHPTHWAGWFVLRHADPSSGAGATPR